MRKFYLNLKEKKRFGSLNHTWFCNAITYAVDLLQVVNRLFNPLRSCAINVVILIAYALSMIILRSMGATSTRDLYKQSVFFATKLTYQSSENVTL